MLYTARRRRCNSGCMQSDPRCISHAIYGVSQFSKNFKDKRKIDIFFVLISSKSFMLEITYVTSSN